MGESRRVLGGHLSNPVVDGGNMGIVVVEGTGCIG